MTRAYITRQCDVKFSFILSVVYKRGYAWLTFDEPIHYLPTSFPLSKIAKAPRDSVNAKLFGDLPSVFIVGLAISHCLLLPPCRLSSIFRSLAWDFGTPRRGELLFVPLALSYFFLSPIYLPSLPARWHLPLQGQIRSGSCGLKILVSLAKFAINKLNEYCTRRRPDCWGAK